ncbi:hypothetical protein SNE40_012974 [Patella caerulea]|uniref:CUB domain-containing protein n=1 Tax=Patella caerulea TaxID=87958 RepID=A0AAN8JLA6_PATCE
MNYIDKKRLTPLKYLTVVLLFCETILLVKSECHSEILDGDQGDIYLGNDEVFPAFGCKYWYIKGGPNKTITISFDSIYIIPGVDGECSQDTLEMGPEPTTIYCGTSRNDSQPYINSYGHVWLKFVSKHRYLYSHFRLKYIVGKPVTNSRTRCGYNLFHCNNGKCIYRDWLCNGLNECGDNSDEDVCNTQPQATTLPSVQCSSNELYCRLKSSSEYRCLKSVNVCDGIEDCLSGEDETSDICTKSKSDKKCYYKLYNSYGHFTSPNYPHPYPNGVSCQWLIKSVETLKPVQLRFVDFNVQWTRNTDHVVIYDGKDINSKVMGVYNGINLPPLIIQSTTNWLLVQFHSDSTVSGRGFNVTYQTKGYCMSDQQSCGDGEYDCYENRQRCDRVWNCLKHGRDERGCDHCSSTEFSCGVKSGKCYHEDVRCDGKSYCFDYSDEKNCTADQCGPHRGLFLCDNGRCIYETWVCDNSDDCHDHSDELDCSGSTTRVIIAAVVGSLICSLLLVVALGCTCKLYLLRTRDHCRQRHSTPLSRLQVELMGRRAPPPSYNEAMLTSRPYEEVRQEIMSRQCVTVAGEINMTNRPLPVPPYEPSTQDDLLHSQRIIDNSLSTEQLIPESNSDSETSGCDNPNYVSDDDELLDLEDNSNIQLQMRSDVGLLAAWRSSSSLSTSDNLSNDTQLLDLTDKNIKECDKTKLTSCTTSTDTATQIPPQSPQLNSNNDSQLPIDTNTTLPIVSVLEPEDSSLSDSSDTVPLINGV